MSKTIIWIVIILVVIGIIWWAFSMHSGSALQSTSGTDQTLNNSTSTASSTAISPSQTSNSDLSQDMTKVDTQMQGLNQDSANADQGMSNNY
jgi:cytoskeletal protein RodZ